MISLSFVDCAKRGNPDGGARDTIPPVLLRTVPENYSTNFKGNEITVYFDEYIKLKDLQQQLIISPPLENQPIITPFSTSKVLKILINDTLKDNTTYSINFGNSIVDNNEENPFEFFKYVFSTGSYIDSLKVQGTVTDALKINPEEKVTVMLYEVDENFTDSIIYNKKPLYIVTTQRDPENFEIENIKEGTYLLVGLKDNNSNYTFEPKTDKIGFVNHFIDVPRDTSYRLNLFKEIPDYKPARPASLNSQKIQFGYEGLGDSIKIKLLSNQPDDFEYRITKDLKSDSLYYWFQPKIDSDSLQFQLTNRGQVDTLMVRMQKTERDSLLLSALKTGALAFDERFQVTGTTPLKNIDTNYIEIVDKDTLSIQYDFDFDQKQNVLSFDFEKTERQLYTITFFPEAITDFFGDVNDTISFKTNTRTTADYGFLAFNLENTKSLPLIVQLVTESGEVRKEILGIENQTLFSFENIIPGSYYVRIVFDENQNGKWDTGNFLRREQAEEVIYFPKLLDIRANWTLNETFNPE
ncbi:MAG: Ig-like domain-containing protein [Flavobacteriaceae bacterium]